MKKIIALVLAVLLGAGWGVRFYWVNHNAEQTVVRSFPKGTAVPFEKDFFDDANANAEGYTTKVLDASLVPAMDFLKSHNAADQTDLLDSHTDYVYAVRVLFANQNSTNKEMQGIGLRQYGLKGTNYILSFDEGLYQLANPKMPGSSFSLRPHTEMEVVLAFDLISAVDPYELVRNNPPQLQISQYPTQKLLALY